MMHMSTQFDHFWKNDETGELEGVTEEVYNVKKRAFKEQNQRDAEHAAFRGDRYFKESAP
jgi:hypothetical protein